MPLSVDLHEDLVEVPTTPVGLHSLNSTLADLVGENGSKSIPLEPQLFASELDAALVNWDLNTPKRKGFADKQRDLQGG